MKTLLFRSLDKGEKEKLTNACNRVIDLLRRELNLEIWECYFVVHVLNDEFPTEHIGKKE